MRIFCAAAFALAFLLAFCACEPRADQEGLKTLTPAPQTKPAIIMEPGISFSLPDGSVGVIKERMFNDDFQTSLGVSISPDGIIRDGIFKGQKVIVKSPEARKDGEKPGWRTLPKKRVEVTAAPEPRAATEVPADPGQPGLTVAELLPQTAIPKNPPKEQAAPQKPVEKSAVLAIPKNSKDMSFLEGKWLCETGLANSRTQEPIKIVFMFDDKGIGSTVTYEPNDECKGKVRAAVDGKGALKVQVDERRCVKNPNNYYTPFRVECTSAKASQTMCRGKEADGSTWSANFRRIN